MDPPFNIYIGLSALIILLPTSAFMLREMADYNPIEDKLPLLHETTNYTSSSLHDDLITPSNPILKAMYTVGKSPIVFMNTKCFALVMLYRFVQHIVLGELRASELHHLRETFWDYLFHKSMFVLFIIDARTFEDTVSVWPVWFTILGSILLLSRLCKDRFEYLASSPTSRPWPLIKIGVLMALFLMMTLCFGIVTIFGDPFSFNQASTTNTLFLLANVTYILTFVLSIITKFLVLIYDMRTTNSVWENRASINYYSDLIFAMSMLIIDLLHQLHLIYISHASVIFKGSCLVRIYTLITEIRRRHRRHKNYVFVVKLMESSFPMASDQDIDNNSDDCAICWDEMDTARKLPCGHLFHNSCLRSWLEQDTSCPTCRTSLKGQQDELLDEIVYESETDSDDIIDVVGVRRHPRNHFFHFDSSRYTNHPFLSWLPTISIEGFM